MDVRCNHCQEPWDIYYLRHDLPHEFLSESDDVNFWVNGGNLTPYLREKAAEKGWVFGEHIYIVLRCNCCERFDRFKEEVDKQREQERIEKTMILKQLLGNDEDGLAAELEDME